MKKNSIILGIAVIALMCAAVHATSVHLLTVSGHSMEPVIAASDVIVVTPPPINPDKLEVGDIIVYNPDTRDEPISITHRIIAIDENGITTKGDSNGEIDDYIVKPSDIAGIYWFKIPYLGSFIRFANTDRGYLSLILLPAMMLIIIEIRKIIKYTEEL